MHQQILWKKVRGAQAAGCNEQWSRPLSQRGAMFEQLVGLQSQQVWQQAAVTAKLPSLNGGAAAESLQILQ